MSHISEMAQGDVRVDAGRASRRPIAGDERGQNERERNGEEHPRIEETDAVPEKRPNEAPSGEPDQQSEDKSLQDRAITILQHHRAYLSRACAEGHANADLARPASHAL